jgi:hypothetical protein
MIDLFQLTAERVHKVPSGWRWCRLDSHNKPQGFIEMQGAIPIGEYKSGPRKGMPKWPNSDQLQTIWIQESEMNAVAEQWESETGKCHKCDGSGKTVASSHVVHGKTYRECKRCKGSGKPTSA